MGSAFVQRIKHVFGKKLCSYKYAVSKKIFKTKYYQ